MAHSSSGCTTLDTTLLDSLPVAVLPPRRVLVFLLLALAVLLQVVPSGWSPLGNGGEGWNAAVARQMALGENLPKLSKSWGLTVQPSLTTLLTAQSFRWLGANEFSARLPAALAVLGICWLVYLIAERLGGANRGLAAGLIAVTTSGPLLHGKVVGGGSLFALGLVLAFYALIRMLEQKPRRLPWLALFWLAVTWSALAGGLSGFWFPALVGLALLPFYREARLRLAVFYSLPGVALALGGGAAWWFLRIAPVNMDPPGVRTVQGIFWMLFPWAVILIVPFFWRIRKILRLKEMDCGEAVLWFWLAAAVVWVVVGGLPGEWPRSMAMLWPVFAICSAMIWERLNSGLKMAGAGLLVVTGIIGAGFCGGMAGTEWLHLLQPIWWLSCGVLIAFGLAALVFVWQRHSRAALLALAAAVIPLAFNLMDARARHAGGESFRDVAWPLAVNEKYAPVLLDDHPAAVSGFLFYGAEGIAPHFVDRAEMEMPGVRPRFILSPKSRLGVWQRLYPGAVISSENATHYLLKVAS